MPAYWHSGGDICASTGSGFGTALGGPCWTDSIDHARSIFQIKSMTALSLAKAGNRQAAQVVVNDLIELKSAIEDAERWRRASNQAAA